MVEDSMIRIIDMLATLSAHLTTLEKRIAELESRGMGEGVYLDGVPDYAKKYIQKEEKEVK